MANVDQGFEEFRCDLIAHLATRFGLAPDVVASHLPAWLLEQRHPDDDGETEASPIPRPRT